MKRILFLCTANSCRSQMAEALANADFAGSVLACSAGSQPGTLDARAVAVMAELGIDISAKRPKPLDAWAEQRFDYVITLCHEAAESCPAQIAGTTPLRWSFDDPPRSAGSSNEILQVYRRVRDEIRSRLGSFLRQELAG